MSHRKYPIMFVSHSGKPETAEAQPFCRIEFNFQVTQDGTVTIHKADCSTDTTIGGLKLDFRYIFGDPKSQEWYYRTSKLADNRTLRNYGIDGMDRNEVKLFVRQLKTGTR